MTRDQIATTVILSTEGALLLFPPLAASVFCLCRWRFGWAIRPIAFGCTGLIAAVWLAADAGFGLRSRLAGFDAVPATYGAFCFLVVASRLVRPRALAMSAGLAGWTAIALGYIAATLGALPLGWLMLDAAGAASASEEVAPGLTCETTFWGMAASASGYTRHLYEAWPFGFRRQVAAFQVMQTEPADPELSCPDAYRRYRHAEGH